jgi:hypothetical protein
VLQHQQRAEILAQIATVTDNAPSAGPIIALIRNGAH